MQLSPTRLFVCTACGATLPVGEEHVGKKCRCGRCGKVSVVGDETPRKQAAATTAQQQRIGFYCHNCDTRIAAQAKHVGKRAKCPDCGALTEVPPPPKPRPKQKPKAMHGQQYGLWGVDDAPNPAEMAAAQPKFFPVWCRVCDTLMHARPEQIGKKLKCPDCGGKTTVEEPPKPEPKKSPLVPDGQEYQLDPTHVPPTRPEFQFSPPTPSPTAPSPTGKDGKKSGKAKAELAPIRQERTERPKAPPLPIIQGVLPMLFRSPVTTWFFWLTMVGLTLGGFMMFVVSLNPIAAIPFFVGAGFSSLLGLGALSSLCLAVLTESSEGNDRLYNPPGPVFLDWAGDVFYLATSATMALAPWWLLCRILEKELPIEAQGMVLLVGWLFTFPLLLLSCLENGSAWEPFSPRMMGSVAKRPLHWLLFVVISFAIVGGAGLAIAAVLSAASTGAWAWALLETPLLVAVSLLYFRVIGRFAWWLAGSLAVAEE